MSPAATTMTNGSTDGTSLKATAPSFHPTGTPNPSAYHAASTEDAIHSEHTHAAHNYHPLPIVFSRASGVSVWDPEGRLTSTHGPCIHAHSLSRQGVSRLLVSIRRRQSGTLSPGAYQGFDRASFTSDTQLTCFLQRCLSALRGICHCFLWL